MQVRGLPRQFTRGARLASRLCAAQRSEAAQRRDIVRRWRATMAAGLTAEQAAQAVGVPRTTLYRWRQRPERRSTRPLRLRTPAWSPELVAAVRDIRTEFSMWGKAKITVILRRQGFGTSESTVGRILKALIDRGVVLPVPTVRRKAPRAQRRIRPHARRLPKGKRPTRPGEIVQIDTLTIKPGQGRPTVKQFTAADPVSKWTCAQAWRRATANNAARFLDKLRSAMPFPVKAIQIDGGSEFKASFETECQRLGIDLWTLPPRTPELNGHVERSNGTWRYEFHAVWDLPDNLDSLNRWIDAFADEFNTWRPHQSLGGQTPFEYLASLTAQETHPIP